MDSYDIFKKLTVGVKFNRKRPIKENVVSLNADNISVTENKKAKIEETEGNEDFRLIEDQNVVVFNKIKKNDPIKGKQQFLEEQVNRLRNSHHISILGKKVPAPFEAFDELTQRYKLPTKLIDNLSACGFAIPTPVQMQSIPIMLEGRSLMACAPTGSGKTVAFLTPIIHDLKEPRKQGFRALVLCPTRELAKQTQRECLRLVENIGLKIHTINKVKMAEQKYGTNSNKKYDILVSTPKRVCYLLNQTPPQLDLKNVEWLIVDEADKLMEEGINSFKEQFDQIITSCTNPNKKLGLFSATYTVPVAKWAVRHMKKVVRITIGERNSATDSVKQELLFVGSESGKLLAFRDLVRNGLQPPVLVFVQSKERARQLFNELLYDGINVDVIHADRTQQQRDNVVKAFREGKIWVLICTELMGRGIDFKGVNLVLNYDFPPTPIAYIHRIGRTGRAGRPGKAITYFTQDDTTNLRSIAQIIKNSGGIVPEYMLKMKKTTKQDKKKLVRHALRREDITTLPKFEIERRRRKHMPGRFVRIHRKPSEDQPENSSLKIMKSIKKDGKSKQLHSKRNTLKENSKKVKKPKIKK